MATEEDLKKLMIAPGKCIANSPTEIRIKIFESALTYVYFQPMGQQANATFEVTVAHLLPAIIHLSVAIQEEAKQALYSKNPVLFTFGQFLRFMRQERQAQTCCCAPWIKRLAVVFSRTDFWAYTGVALVPPVSELQDRDSYYKGPDSPGLKLDRLKIDICRLGWLPSSHYPWTKEIARCIGRHLSKRAASTTIVGEANRAERRCMKDILHRIRPTHDSSRWCEIHAYWVEVKKVLSSTQANLAWDSFVESGMPLMPPTFPWISSHTRQRRGPFGTQYSQQLPARYCPDFSEAE